MTSFTCYVGPALAQSVHPICRHEAEAAELRTTSSAQSQLLQAAKDEADLTILSLRKQLQQEADQNRATNQVHVATAITLAAVLWYCHVHFATDTFTAAMSSYAVHPSVRFF